MSDEQHQNQQQQKQQAEALRTQMLSQILTNEARERLNRIGLVKPERARHLEDLILQQARTGRLRGSSDDGRFGDADLLRLLDQVIAPATSSEGAGAGKISIIRRNAIDDEDF